MGLFFFCGISTPQFFTQILPHLEDSEHFSGSCRSCQESKRGEGLVPGGAEPWQVLAVKRWMKSHDFDDDEEMNDVFYDENKPPLGGGNSNIYYFQHEPWGDDEQFDFCIFFKWVGSKPPTSTCQMHFFSNIHAVSVRLPNTWVFWRYCMYQDLKNLKDQRPNPRRLWG